MTTTEKRNELANQVLTATPEEQQLIMLYLNGMKYAKANPASTAAQIVAEIQHEINNDGNQEKVKALTLQLAHLTAERN